ncbi:hypothetical protein H9Y04_14410 [Streptomyces sp. TRM66268-LWL]|uniref:Uncharacterized protein n=1 Tax=Streptomyces polyasparticus TaxID=2767826 RepID=A0ABR7SE32_9ACTN|nr:hypothetical protein [Streptomyces polyasparticus]
MRPPHRHTPRRRTAYRRAPREIDGLPRRVQAEIDRLERTRNYLYSGSVTDAVLRWQEFARSPARTLWDLRDADLEFYCCGDPFAARELLAFVEQALSRPAARALRAVLAEADARWEW